MIPLTRAVAVTTAVGLTLDGVMTAQFNVEKFGDSNGRLENLSV